MPPPVEEKPAKPEVPAEPAAAKAPPKFKLKKKNPEPAPTAADPSGDSAEPPIVEKKSESKDDKAPTSAMPPPPMVHLKAADDLDEDEILLNDKNAGRPVKKGIKPLVGVVVLLVIGVGGYFGWQYFGPGATEQAPSQGESTSVDSPKKPATTLPGQLIEKGQAAIEARRQGEQDRVDAVLDGKDVPDKSF